MKYLKISNYVKVLLSEGTKWEYQELLPTTELDRRKILKYSWSKRGILAIPTLGILLFINRGFSEAFMNYVMTALSIFIGLFTNLIIVLYQRYPQKNDTPSLNNLQAINEIKIKNFIRQFTFVTGKNLLIATIVIVLLSLFMMFESLATFNPLGYNFVDSAENIDFNSLKLFFKGLLSLPIRAVIIYALIDFSVLLLYSLGSLFAFLKGEYYT